MVGARTNCSNDLFRFRGRKNELDVFRRFFNEFEQSIEPLWRNHVGLVEDENFEAVTSRRECCALTKLAGIIHTVMARGIDFDDIHRTTAVTRKFNTTRAHSTGRVGWPLGTIQTPCEDARGSSFPAAAGPTEKVRMIDAIRPQSRHQRIGHLRLPDHFGERLGPVTAIQCGGHETIVRCRCDRAVRLRVPRTPLGQSQIPHSWVSRARQVSPQ